MGLLVLIKMFIQIYNVQSTLIDIYRMNTKKNMLKFTHFLDKCKTGQYAE